MGELTRREFVGSVTAGAVASVALSGRAAGANERVRLGVIGVGNRGMQLVSAIQQHADAEIVAVCDVYQPFMEKAAGVIGGTVAQEGDFRKLLERGDIDAVVVASPDHWHALHTVMACDAGKDVYVEKPLSITVHEGRRMVEAAKRNNRIVQVGTQRRSSPMFMELAKLVREGTLGKVTVSRSYRLTNMAPAGIGKLTDGEPPAGLDWDMWLGPRAVRPYRDNIAPYKFRWWGDYSSQMANWGVHSFDAIRWLVNADAPASVVALGGVYAVEDDRSIPDTAEAIFEFPAGGLMVFGQYEASGTDAMKKGWIELRGTKGTLFADDRGWEVEPEEGGQFQEKGKRMEALSGKPSGGDATVLHMRNFLDCVKSRQAPNADVETGHRSTTFSLLANIALAARARIDWDPVGERITNHDELNNLLHYDYRAPWKLA